MPRGVCNDPVAEAARLAKISAAKKGRPHSPEHAANISAALTGRSLSPEHRARVSATRLRGRRIQIGGADYRSSKHTGGSRECAAPRAAFPAWTVGVAPPGNGASPIPPLA